MCMAIVTKDQAAGDQLHWMRKENPPNAPQIPPIEKFWGMLKMKVYEGNWTAQDHDQLI